MARHDAAVFFRLIMDRWKGLERLIALMPGDDEPGATEVMEQGAIGWARLDGITLTPSPRHRVDEPDLGEVELEMSVYVPPEVTEGDGGEYAIGHATALVAERFDELTLREADGPESGGHQLDFGRAVQLFNPPGVAVATRAARFAVVTVKGTFMRARGDELAAFPPRGGE